MLGLYATYSKYNKKMHGDFVPCVLFSIQVSAPSYKLGVMHLSCLLSVLWEPCGCFLCSMAGAGTADHQ